MALILSPLQYEGAPYISFDPGKTTGVVQWDGYGNPTGFHELDEEGLDEFLDCIESWPIKPKVVILEEYRVYASYNHTGSKVITIQVIGGIKRTARRVKAGVAEVRADNKRIAALWSGTSVPKGHMPHWMAAFLVGYWYLHTNGIIKARVLDES